MPGPYIHIAAADAVAAALKKRKGWAGMPLALPGLEPSDVADILDGNQSHYSFGAIGPDLFFFLADFRSVGGVRIANPLLDIGRWLNDLYKNFDDNVLGLYVESFGGPLSEDLTEQMGRFTGDLSTTISKVMSQFSSVFLIAIEDLASQSSDWFAMFSMGLNKGIDNQDFVWSDMLHYRRTAQFALQLWANALAERASADAEVTKAKAAKDQAALDAANAMLMTAKRHQAYALGYATHIATDTAAHGFVNQKSGGPFRTHWQRHHLVENHMDAEVYNIDRGGQRTYNMLTEAALHYRIAFSQDGGSTKQSLPDYDPTSQSLQQHYLWRRRLDLNSELPDDLAEFISKTLELYPLATGTDPVPLPSDSSPGIIQGNDGRPTVLQIQDAYLWLYRYIKMATTDGFAYDKPTPPDVFPNWEWPVLTDPHSEAPDEQDNKIDFFHHPLLFLLKLFLFILLFVVWLVTIIPSLIGDLVTYLPRLLTYYAIELPLYYIVKLERSVLVATGYTLPMQDEIDSGLIELGRGTTSNFSAVLAAMDTVGGDLKQDALDLMNGDLVKLMTDFGMTAQDAAAVVLAAVGPAAAAPMEPVHDSDYPHQHADGEFHHPWDYPTTDSERPKTQAGPFSAGDRPHILLDAAMPGSQITRARFEHALDPAAADSVLVDGTHNLGDPVWFAQYLIWQYTRDAFPSDSEQSAIADWNLDSDRGYGYRCWDWNRFPDQGVGMRSPATHVFKDLDNHDFLAPCTSPSQRIDGLPDYNGKADLLLHFTDQPDPGCPK